MTGKLSRNDISLPANTRDEVQKFFDANPLAIFRIPEVRDAIVMYRLAHVSEDNIEISPTVDEGAIENVISYNLEALKNVKDQPQTLRRPDLLIGVLKNIGYIRSRIPELKVLCVGPRTEVEFFAFLAEGFKSENLTGLDLMSYSEYVDVGDMHHMPYEDNSFDIVFVGWTLTYSRDLQRVADECRRVAKPGGYIAVGVESDGRQKKSELHGFTLNDAINITSTDEIVDLFEGHVHAVPFRHDVHRSLRDSLDMVMVIIELK